MAVLRHTYAASWISGVTRDPENPSDVLVSFNDYCVMGNLNYLAEWTNPGDYQWYAGASTWTATAAAAGSLISGATPLAISVSDFSALGRGLILVEQTSDAGAFAVYQASRPAGTWTETTTGTVPCTIEGDDFCHALVAHPELSTSAEYCPKTMLPAVTRSALRHEHFGHHSFIGGVARKGISRARTNLTCCNVS